MRARDSEGKARIRRVRGHVIRYRYRYEGGAYSICAALDDTAEICVKDAARSRAAAEELTNLLAEHAVFPCHLEEIVEDLLA